ncbi:pyroglutamyl-peptidase [Saccharothrix saharensis]|uniref:Pyroglutamyl-peptidase I n=1 Tax=Saccharothrix saharensis TaxID=571190 RepID=A0A543JFE9_9PSEU|nr:pyroglutamyl-peptidase I [Saccharothrix saharensis]TQM81578.1 pyroglutamyl-peptidase [Saccharothrix saharensis]
MDVLLTGFEPFAGEDTNPSWDAVDAVRPDGYRLTRLRLPCVFGDAIAAVRGALAARRHDLVVCVGQAGGRAGITPERVAVNLDDARIPDNAGAQPVDEPVVPGGPAAYFTGLPVKACVAALEAEGIPASVSHTAGTFVCNHVFYGLMHLIATEHPGVRGGFVHVPFSPAQAEAGGHPSLPVATTARALELIVHTALTTSTDLRTTAGTLH